MAERINVEDYAKRHKPIPVGVGYEYEIRVNKDQIITIPKRMVTAREILELAGKNIAEEELIADYGNGRLMTVGNNDMIDLTQGVIKFTTLHKNARNG